MHWPIALIGVIAATAMATACGSDQVEEPAQPPRATELSKASFETCTGFLDLEDVRKAAGRDDIQIGGPNVISGDQEPDSAGIKTRCVVEYITPEILNGGPTQLGISGPSVTITGLEFDSAESAASQYKTVLEAVRFTRDNLRSQTGLAEGVIGDDSFLLVMELEGIGSIIAFLVGPYLMQLHTTLPDGQPTLVSPRELTSLAAAVQTRLVALERFGYLKRRSPSENLESFRGNMVPAPVAQIQ